MPEETTPTTIQPTATTEAPATTTGVSPTVAAPAAATVAGSESGQNAPAANDWASALETVDPAELRRHPRVAGIVGDLLSKEKTRWKAEQEQEISRTQADEAETRLRKLAEDDPVAFSEQYLTQAQQTKLQKDLAGLKGQTRQEMAAQIRTAVETMPEFKELSQEDVLDIARATAGKSDEQVLGAFSLALVEKVSGKRAAKQFQERWDKELSKEREAIRAEEAAKLLKRERGPDMTRPSGAPGRVDLSQIPDDAEFNRRYEEDILNKRVLSRYR